MSSGRPLKKSIRCVVRFAHGVSGGALRTIWTHTLGRSASSRTKSTLRGPRSLRPCGWRFLIGLKSLLIIFAFFLLGAAPAPSRFENARPGYSFSFPRDHGSHPTYGLEWWYFTGRLASAGKEYGYELTFFRKGIENPKGLSNPSQWTVRNLYFAHLALTDLPDEKFLFEDKIGREALGKAGAKREGLDVWIDSWRAEGEGGAIRLRADGAQNRDRWKIDLTLTPTKPPVIHGEEGISRKGDEAAQATHYISFTRLKTAGALWIGGKEAPVEGTSWMDHEFGSGVLNARQVGWDWFSIQLDDGSEYMLYQLRTTMGEIDPNSSGTFIASNGEARHLTADAFSLKPIQYWKSPASGGNYPVGWKIEIPSEGLLLESTPSLPDQELITSQGAKVAYWEGAGRFRGTKQGKPISGKGYVELTGYAK